MVKDNGELCVCIPSATGGTTNYWSHLKVAHKQKWLELEKKAGRLAKAGQKELSSLLTSLQEHHLKLDEDEVISSLPLEAKAAIDAIIAKWIIKRDMDICEAECPEFQAIMKIATSGGHNGTSRDTVDSIIVCRADEGRTNAAQLAQTGTGEGMQIPISADLWSKRGVALLGVMLYLIDEYEVDGVLTWELKEALAGAIPASKHHHTANWIKGTVRDALLKLGLVLETHIHPLIRADEGANIKKGLGSKPCVCHKVQTDIKKSWNKQPVIAQVAAQGRGQVGYLHSSTIGGADFRCCASILGWECPSLPTQDVATRWRSERDLSNSLRERQDVCMLFNVKYAATSAAAPSYSSNKYTLDNWVVNNQGSAVPYGLAAASNLLEGKNYPTSNLILPTMLNNTDAMDVDRPTKQPWDGEMINSEDYHPAITEGREMLHAQLVDTWVDMTDDEYKRFLYIVTLCDPRFKSLKIPLITPAMRDQAWKWFDQAYEIQYSPTNPASPASPLAGAAAEPDSPHIPSTLGSVSGFMEQMSHLQASPSKTPIKQEPNLSEVELYKAMPVPHYSTDILKWWPQQTQLPNLRKMARQYLSVPATSASCERVFSLAGRLFSDERQNMNEEKLEDRMWAKANMDLY